MQPASPASPQRTSPVVWLVLARQFYFEHRKAVSESLSHLSMTFPAYRKLDWRLDVEVRSCRV